LNVILKLIYSYKCKNNLSWSYISNYTKDILKIKNINPANWQIEFRNDIIDNEFAYNLITSNMNLFCCSSTVTDGRVVGRRQGGRSPFRAHRPSNRSRAARRPSFDPGTSPTPVLRIPGILQPPKSILVIPMHVAHIALNAKLVYKVFQDRQTFLYY